VLRLTDDWVWDSWVADDGERYHLFFLKAPRALRDSSLRHTAASIGHATGVDLEHWDVHEDALTPEAGCWDDLALWTGSVVRGDDRVWRLYYSALSTSRGFGERDQRIGLAESDDLFTWRRVGDRPLVAPEPRWYRTLDEDPALSATWRDPFVFRDPDGKGWHMLITARAASVPWSEGGVLGHARSADMRRWVLQPPLSAPAGFGELEVPQIRNVEGRHVLVFTCQPEQHSADRIAPFSTWYVIGDALTGPWKMENARPFTAEPTLSAAPLIQRRDASWVFLGFRNRERDGIDSFEILNPIPVTVRGGDLQPAAPTSTRR
jgi:beta-fructofuranosidase